MSFGALYKDVQGLQVPVLIDSVRTLIANLLPERRVCVLRMELDPTRCKGFYLSSRNEDTAFHPHVKPGAAVIAISKHLDAAWSRYVEVKELLHLFDDPLHTTNSQSQLEQLLLGLCDGSNAIPRQLSTQEQSEYDCMWMALALLCPEEERATLQVRREAKLISDAEIADRLEIPELMLTVLFSPVYKDQIARILSKQT